MPIQSQDQLPGSPDVRYLQAPALFQRPHIPTRDWPIAAGLLAAAVIIGVVLGLRIVDNVVYADNKNADKVAEAIAAVDPQPVPVLTDHRDQGSGDLRAVLEEAGLALVENEVAEEEGVDQLDISKLPAGMDQALLDTAASEGVERLPSPEAAAYLADSWNLTMSRSGSVNLRVRYQMFGPATVEQAIVQTVEAQGWQGSNIGESGTDQMGNSYQHGTIDIDGKQWRWSVYACPLSDVYSISGLPESSWYVSARLMG